jgi:Family of unknown function (DUF6677)
MTDLLHHRILLVILGSLAVGMLTSLVSLERRQYRQAAAFWLSWFVPGLGHVVMGRWRKGLFFAAALLFLQGAGLWLCGGRVVAFDENQFYYVGQFGSGMTSLAGLLLTSDRPFRADLPLSWYDPGLLYVCVAGLLNLVLMMNVTDIKSAAPAKAAIPAPVAAEPEPASGVEETPA